MLRLTGMQIFDKIPIQKHGPKKSSNASHLLQKSGQQQKTTLEISNIILTTQRGYDRAVCVDKLLCDSFFHELLDLENE